MAVVLMYTFTVGMNVAASPSRMTLMLGVSTASVRRSNDTAAHLTDFSGAGLLQGTDRSGREPRWRRKKIILCGAATEE